MKRIGCMGLAMMLAVSLLAGCGSLDSETSMIFVGKKGEIQTIDVEPFDKSYYREEDFTAFAQEAIDAYNSSHGEDAVTLTEFVVTEDVAKLKMEYKSIADYNGFSGISLYQGTVAEAVSEGYLFDVDFSRVEDGEVTGSAVRADILSGEGLYVVIIKANTDVQVDGEIYYVSNENVTVTAKDKVSIRDEENASLASDVSTYIIYK